MTQPQLDPDRCVSCGECVLACPNAAWTRSDKKYYRLTLLGRTGKKNPRLGEDFIKWADEDSIIKIILNTYDYVKEYIDPNAPGGKEHLHYAANAGRKLENISCNSNVCFVVIGDTEVQPDKFGTLYESVILTG